MAQALDSARATAVSTLLMAVMIAGCSTADGPGSGGSSLGGGGQMTIVPITLPTFGHTAPGTPAELYVKLARLAKACWFAPPAPLQVGYVFSADVTPSSKGGVATIVIYEHNDGALHGASAERGLIAFEITLSPSGDNTLIASANYRIPKAFAERMTSDVDRWADGETSCASTAPWATNAALGDSSPPAGGKPAKAAAHP